VYVKGTKEQFKQNKRTMSMVPRQESDTRTFVIIGGGVDTTSHRHKQRARQRERE
jgi:hypothetical protein